MTILEYLIEPPLIGSRPEFLPVRILIICSCHDDADLIEPAMRHASGFCDAIVAVDRESTDGTREILASLQREGMPIIVFDDPRPGDHERERRSAVYQNVGRFFKPDFTIVLEAGELILCRDRSAMLKEIQAFDGFVDLAVRCAIMNPDAHAEDFVRDHLPIFGSQSVSEVWETGRLYSGWKNDILGHSPKEDPPPRRHDNVLRCHSFQIARFPRAERRRFLDQTTRLKQETGIVGRTYRDLEMALDERRNSPSDGSEVGTDNCFERLLPILISQAAWGRSGGKRLKWSEPSSSWRPSSASGALSAKFHLENLYLDLPPFRYLWDRYRPASVLDLGCGVGGYVEMLRRWGAANVLGVDGFREPLEFLARGCYRQADLRENIDLAAQFDLVICTEVLEHIDAKYESAVLDNVANHAQKVVLFSAARPDQPGVGHVNCRSPEYWLERWAALGWEPAIFETLAVRSLSTFYWFRRNLIVLVPTVARRGQDRGFAAEDLDSVEARHTPWFGEAPGIYTFPLAVDVPPLTFD